MHLNYYFIKRLSLRLNNELTGLILSNAYSQNKDELILRFVSDSEDKDFFIRCMLSPNFSCLSFPAEFHRARKNSVNLLPDLINHKILKVAQFKNERAFVIQFEKNYSLVFKLFGNRSNIVLLRNAEFIDMFHKKMESDIELKMPLDRNFGISYEKFDQNPDIKVCFPTLRGLPEIYLETRNYEKASNKEKWDMILETIKILSENEKYYLIRYEGIYHLSMLPLGDIFEEENDIIKACNLFYQRFVSTGSFTKDKRQLLSALHNEIQRAENYIDKTGKKLRKIKEENNYQHIGDIIMANIKNILPRCPKVILKNFYTDKDIEIRLNPELSPQKNAENYYRKTKNQFLEIRTLEKNLAERKKKLEELNKKSEAIQMAESQKELKNHKKNIDRVKPGSGKKSLPYYERDILGFKFIIGKNARSNDSILNTHSRKDDLWLHVKNAPGSHVIIKYQSGKHFSKEVIEKAAQLAAYYSKRKSETLVPVSYTPRKFIRKRKGDPPGTVVVEKEKVILVEPLG